MEYSRLLKRQIKKIFGDIENVPDEFLPFLTIVNQSYEHYEGDKSLLEHTMDTNSLELTRSNALLRAVASEQRDLVNSLKSSVNDLRLSNNSGNNEDGSDIGIENISDIIQNEIRIKNQYEESLKRSEKRQEQQLIVQGIISDLLSLSHKKGSINDVLTEALDILLKLPFVQLVPKIGVFLAKNNELKLAASKNFSTSLIKTCGEKNVAFGECLCGRAALTKKIVFASCVDDRHDIKPEGITEHGHYNVPIIIDKEVLGVIVFYLPHGYKKNEEEIEILKSVASTLGLIIKKNKADKKLKESEEKYRDLFENASDLIQSIDIEGYFVYVNQAWKDKLGYDDDDLKTLNFMDVIHPDEQTHCMNLFSEVVKCERKLKVQTVFLSKAGEKIIVEGNVNCKVSSPTKIHTRGIFRDITEQDTREKELVKIKSAIEQSESSIVITNAKNEIEYVNPYFEELTGYSFEEVKGLNPRILQSGLTERSEYKDLWKSISEKGRWKGEFCNRKKNGELFWENVNISVIKDKEGNPINYISVKDDITKQKKLAETLKKKEEEYKQIVESANDVIFRADIEGFFTYVNPLMEKLTGVPADKLLQMHFTQIITKEYREEVQSFYMKQFKSLEPSSYKEFKIINNNGGTRWVGQNVRAIIKGDRVVSFTAVARDITDIKEIQNELIQAKEIAEDSARTKEMFLANMSHEIRTPMNAIVGMTNLLSESELTNKQEDYLRAIKTSGDNLLVIINDILDISKIESGKLKIEKINFDFRELINNTKRSIELKAEEKDLLFSLDIKDDVPSVLVSDPVRLNQVLINLLGNSIKFTKKGSVSLICSVMGIENEEAKIKFEVKDTGVGIDSNKLDKIFESFAQEDESTTRKFGGTGLGLSISRQLVSLLGGELEVESELGNGANFYFTLNLPIGENAVKKKKIIIDIGTNPLKNKKVLLAEDNEINSFLATTVLSKWDIEVDVAEDGQIAVDKLKTNVYDVVLMDIQMPVMGGLEATQVIRKQLKLDIPIIALTANAVKGDREEFLLAGMDDYISKPFDATILFNKLVSYIVTK